MSKITIEKIRARQIFDSRGRPTVETDVHLSDGSIGSASVPSGASTGTFEAFELRDGDANFYDGLGVSRAVANVNGEIDAFLKGKEAFAQREIDESLIALDGTENLRRLGANAILSVSLATARAAANARKIPLYLLIKELSETIDLRMPLPMVNILSGGLHARAGMDVQDFLFVPAAAKTFDEAIRQIARVRLAAEKLAKEKGIATLLADEGGLSPGFSTSAEALDFMVETFERARLKPFDEARIAIDVAASTLQTGADEYFLPRENLKRSSAEMIEMVADWARQFPVISVEDALGEEDWENWKALNQKLGAKIQIVGDDFFTTNLKRVARGIDSRCANAVLVKLNQNGTLSGTLDVIKTAKANNWRTVISARSGETEDAFLADLAVGTNGGQIKIGSFRNSERLAKYNRLVQIAEETGAPLAAWQSL